MIEKRFMKYVNKTDTCWLWTGFQRGKGYGGFQLLKRKIVAAHRFSYELYKGPIPEGMQIDHLCSVKLCVNPDHLEPVDNKENQRRAADNRGGLYPIQTRERRPVNCLVCGSEILALQHERRKYCSNACNCKAKRQRRVLS